jgi:two-component system LytT family response regulator
MSTPITTVIIAIPNAIRERALRVLDEDPDFTVVGTYDSMAEAARSVRALAPRLVLVGTECREPLVQTESIRGLGENGAQPQVIVLAADAASAVAAHSLGALDYLLMPLDANRLVRALARAKARMWNDRDAAAAEARAEEDASGISSGRLLVPAHDGTVTVLATRDIHYCQAHSKHVHLHVGEAVHVLRCPLRELEARLDPGSFVRAHRATLINIEHISEIQPLVHGDCRVLMGSGVQLTLSRRYRKRLNVLLGGRRLLPEDHQR